MWKKACVFLILSLVCYVQPQEDENDGDNSGAFNHFFNMGWAAVKNLGSSASVVFTATQNAASVLVTTVRTRLTGVASQTAEVATQASGQGWAQSAIAARALTEAKNSSDKQAKIKAADLAVTAAEAQVAAATAAGAAEDAAKAAAAEVAALADKAKAQAAAAPGDAALQADAKSKAKAVEQAKALVDAATKAHASARASAETSLKIAEDAKKNVV